MIVEPEPVTLDEFVTSIVSTVLLSLVFLIVIFPVSTSTASEKVNSIFADKETPIALSAGELELSVGSAAVVKLNVVELEIPANDALSSLAS